MTNEIKELFVNAIDKDPLLKVILTPLAKYISDDITDIHIDRPTEVILDHADGSFSVLEDIHLNKSWLEKMAFTMASISHQKFDKSHTRVGFKLPGGHRCQVISGPCIEDSFAIAIRLNRGIRYEIESFGLKKTEADILKKSVKNKKTILISGGTGSGKTSFLNTLIDYIPYRERILTIEDVPEILINKKNHPKINRLYFSSSNLDQFSTTAKDLLNDVMRMNPSRIILGEIRHKNALTFRNAINSGHEGSLATIHANTPHKALEKLLTYIKEEDNIEASIESLCFDIFGIVQLYKTSKGNIRSRFTKTSELFREKKK